MVIAIPRTPLGLRLLEEAGLPTINAHQDSSYSSHVLLSDDECRQRPTDIAGVLRALQAMEHLPNDSFALHVWLDTLAAYSMERT